MRHLVTNQVGFPVESLGTLVALVLPLLGVDYHVLLQAGKKRQAELAWQAAARAGSERSPNPSAHPNRTLPAKAHTVTELLPRFGEV